MAVLPLAVALHLAASCPATQAMTGRMQVSFLATYRGVLLTESRIPGSADLLDASALRRNTNGTLDAGIAQVNSTNWPRFGLDARTVFDPQRNVCAGAAILAEEFVTEWRASCRYNTGRPDCANGYPEKVLVASAARLLPAIHIAGEIMPPAPEVIVASPQVTVLAKPTHGRALYFTYKGSD